MTGALDLVRPFAWLAVIAFLVGFVSYLALGEPATARVQGELQPVAYEAVASGPVSADWNVARQL